MGGKRIAGTGGGRMGDPVVVVDNLLFDFDFAAMTAVWNAPAPGFRLFEGETLRESIATLKGSGIQGTMDEVTGQLIRSFAKKNGAAGRTGRQKSFLPRRRWLYTGRALNLSPCGP